MIHNNALSSGFILKGKSYTYRIEDILGQGSFGITYLATTHVMVEGSLGHLDTTIKVAIKEFFMQDFNGRENSIVTHSGQSGLYDNYKRKFAREAKNLSTLKHPGIVRVLEFFEANNTVYYSMEYCEGGDLNALIERCGALNQTDAIEYFKQAATALSIMHSQNILHLDLKPSNIMLRRNKEIVLIDFGLSKHYVTNGEPESSTTIGGGTPGYAPLEQINYRENQGLAFTIDVYALGATLYKMLTGKRPPEASYVFNEGFPREELQQKNIGPKTIDCIEKAMSSAKKQRYQTVAEFADALIKSYTLDNPQSPKSEYSEKTEFTSPKDEKAEHKSQKNEKTELNEESPRKESRGFAKEAKSFNSPKVVPTKDSKQKNTIEENSAIKNKKGNVKTFITYTLVVAAIIWVHTIPSVLHFYGDLFSGVGFDKSALRCYEAAAGKGYIKSMTRLGYEYINGGFVQQNMATALKWFIEADRYDPTGAEACALGTIYWEGLLTQASDGEQVTDNHSEAAKWYNIAAEKGYSQAMRQLGYMYENGKGVTQDIAKALNWYRRNLTMEQNSPDSETKTVDFLKERISTLEKDSLAMLSTEKVNAGKKVNTGKKENHSNLSTSAKPDYYIKGDKAYSNGDYFEAFQYYEKAAKEDGNVSAMVAIGRLYEKGQGVSKDINEAINWYRKAANKGNALAKSKLNELTQPSKSMSAVECYNKGVDAQDAGNYAEALKWYKQAAQKGDLEAQNNIGYYYSKGMGVTQDLAEALKWYLKAAEGGSAEAQYNVGTCYYNGSGVAKDMTEAEKWFKRAAQQGHIAAQDVLDTYF